MSPKVIGDVAASISIDNSVMAYLTRGTPEMTKYCYEGTSTPRKGFIFVSRFELAELNTRSTQRKRVESWLREVQAPIGNYPPNYDETHRPKPPEYPHPWQSMQLARYRKNMPRLDPPTQEQLNPALIRTDPVELPSQEELPILSSKLPSVFHQIRVFERERGPNPVSPPNWGKEMYEAMADAYLKWKDEHKGEDLTVIDLPPPPDPTPNAYHSVEIFGKSWYSSRFTFHPNPPSPNSTSSTPTMTAPPINTILISHSLLSNAQRGPQWAVSLYLLEEFHALRTGTQSQPLPSPSSIPPALQSSTSATLLSTLPSIQTASPSRRSTAGHGHGPFGIERYLRPICEAQGKEYNSSLYNRFRGAYAVFVGILRCLEKRREKEAQAEKTAVAGAGMGGF